MGANVDAGYLIISSAPGSAGAAVVLTLVVLVMVAPLTAVVEVTTPEAPGWGVGAAVAASMNGSTRSWTGGGSRL